MMALLPLCGSSGRYEWAIGVRKLLQGLSQGPAISSVKSGKKLFDCIVDMRHESGMKDYNMHPNSSHGLQIFFEEVMPQDSAKEFFRSVLPSMARLALSLPVLIEQHSTKWIHDFGGDVHLRVLVSQKPAIVLLSQELVACLLACSFFCLYPSERRNEADLPKINFNSFFAHIYEQNGHRTSQQNKMMCILHYFERVCKKIPDGMVSYERKVIDAVPGSPPDSLFWSTSDTPLCKFELYEDGNIETHDGEAVEIDFANKYLGGGVLGGGCVQEEIRFMTNPELIVGMLFLPMMEDNEAIEIFGAECYSRYTGYARSFTFAGDYCDNKPRDRWGRRMTRIVAIDAIPNARDRQYKETMILREVNKAFCGFLDHNLASKMGDDVGVATGNWGCGAFGGDLQLKSMIQWLAASEAKRPFILYYTFSDPRAERMRECVHWIKKESWTVGELWNTLVEYGGNEQAGKSELFDWLRPVNPIHLFFCKVRKFFDSVHNK